MNHYMIDIHLPVSADEGFNERVPEQMEMINEMMDEELILSWSLSLDNQRAWIIMTGESEEEIVDIISEFPLISYLKYSIHQLSLYNNYNDTEIPPFSLN